MRERKIEKYLIKSPKQMLIVIAVFTLMIFVGGTTYAFFNYTRTGDANTIKVGRISFVTRQTKTISLTNLFPIDPTNSEEMSDETKVGTLEIEIEGDTDYNKGVEYLVSSTNTHITTSTGKLVPISLSVTPTNLGTENVNYFTAREDKNATIYKKLVGDTIVGDQMLLVGFIKPNTTSGTIEGVNGKLTIKAYLDENKILISDTYDGTESDNMGTPNEVARGKTVLTTTEWNALSTSGVSFQIKVEANEGIWVNNTLDNIMRTKNLNTTTNQPIMDNVSSEFVSASTGIDFGAVSSSTNGQGVYMRAGTENDAYPIVYYRGAVEDNNVVFNNKCWKAVRTTDTGGVKLIYNGEQTSSYTVGEHFEQSKYIDVETAKNAFTFDSSDNTWNTTITSLTNPEIIFTLPSGSNYVLNVTGTTSQSTGGTFYIYKDGSNINSQGFGSGNPISISYTLGTLTSDNVIRLFFGVGGNLSQENPITLKVKIEQNSIALSRESYNLGLAAFSFDNINYKWTANVQNNSATNVSFKLQNTGNYLLNYTNPGGGTFVLKRNNDTIGNSSTGSQKIIINNVLTSDIFSLEYLNYNNQSYSIDIFMSEIGDSMLGCDNSGTDTHISLSGTNTFVFNTNDNSPAYAGYMWGKVYEYSTSNWTSGARFGSSFTWDGTNYKLTDATVTTPNDTHHYSCNSTDAEATCTSIRYVYWSKYYITISEGKGIEEAIKDMQTNTNPSNAKTQIDAWYLSNMNNVTNRLEDAIWCNDRSIERYNGWSATGTINGASGYKNYSLLFGAHERSNHASGTSATKNQPSLACANKNDAFTVSNGNGNQKLTYPVALLTEDEIVLAGGVGSSNSSYYLTTGNSYWSLSPCLYNGVIDTEFNVGSGGSLDNDTVFNTLGLRPAISLKPGMPVISGTGTVTDPYVIE